ncbi:hypothetical protein [Actinophytocola xanthii]|uniref:hypothetical protein n=1 Tax=Actinophytocola xanthii TaxID=1912961 RepID=UPI00130114D0|nr:hypothetical protein [Actinophytocola xanthii]
MALDPSRRSPRLLATLAAFALLPLLAACNDEGDDDDGDDDDSMGARPAVVMMVSQ